MTKLFEHDGMYGLLLTEDEAKLIYKLVGSCQARAISELGMSPLLAELYSRFEIKGFDTYKLYSDQDKYHELGFILPVKV